MYDYVCEYKGRTSASRVVHALLLNQALNLQARVSLMVRQSEMPM